MCFVFFIEKNMEIWRVPPLSCRVRRQVDPANAFTRMSYKVWQWACSMFSLSWHNICSLFAFCFWKPFPKRPGQVSLILFPPHILHKTHEGGSLLRLQMVHRKIVQLVWSVNWIGTCWVPKATSNPRKASGEPHCFSQVTQHICLMTRLTWSKFSDVFFQVTSWWKANIIVLWTVSCICLGFVISTGLSLINEYTGIFT